MSNKVEVEILSDDGEIYKFKTSDQIIKWAENELDIWQKFYSSISQHIKTINDRNIIQFWNQIMADLKKHQVGPVSTFVKELKEQPELVQQTVSNFNELHCLISKTPKGQKVLELSENSADIAILLLSVWHPNCSAESIVANHQHHMHLPAFKALYPALMHAYTEAHLFERGFKGTAKVEKMALQTAKNEANEMLAEMAEDINDLHQRIKDTDDYYTQTTDKFDKLINIKTAVAKRIIKSKISQLDKLKKKYTEELALQIPVTYWSDKAKDHRNSALIWGVVFVVTIAAIIFNASDIFHQIIEGLKIVDKDGKELFNFTDNQLSLFFAITFPAFLAVWVLRIFSKNMLTNLNHMYDAKNRAVMTQTFLALMSEKMATDNDRILILNALFQPMSAHSDDGAPPHWFELMTERMKSK